jgi:hypothetical protein
MKNDSISASSKIKELINLHKSGILTDDEYHDLLKSHIISHLNIRPLKELGTEEESVKGSGENGSYLSGKIEKDIYGLLKSDSVHKSEAQPIKEKVEKVLWIHLN